MATIKHYTMTHVLTCTFQYTHLIPNNKHQHTLVVLLCHSFSGLPRISVFISQHKPDRQRGSVPRRHDTRVDRKMATIAHVVVACARDTCESIRYVHTDTWNSKVKTTIHILFDCLVLSRENKNCVVVSMKFYNVAPKQTIFHDCTRTRAFPELFTQRRRCGRLFIGRIARIASVVSQRLPGFVVCVLCVCSEVSCAHRVPDFVVPSCRARDFCRKIVPNVWGA